MHVQMREQAVQLWYATKSQFSSYFDCAHKMHNTRNTNMLLLKFVQMNAQTPLCVLKYAQVAKTHPCNPKVVVLMLAEILFSLEI